MIALGSNSINTIYSFNIVNTIHTTINAINRLDTSINISCSISSLHSSTIIVYVSIQTRHNTTQHISTRHSVTLHVKRRSKHGATQHISTRHSMTLHVKRRSTHGATQHISTRHSISLYMTQYPSTRHDINLHDTASLNKTQHLFKRREIPRHPATSHDTEKIPRNYGNSPH